MLHAKLLKISSSKWAFIFVPPLVARLSVCSRCACSRSRSRSLISSLRSLSTSLLPRYLVQLFRRLKGPRYADMLFVTRESRHGCLRQAGRQTRLRRRGVFPLSRGNCERRGAAYRTLIFRQRFSPFPVDFRRLFYLPACLLSRGEQADFNRLEDAPLDGATTREDWMRSRSIDAIYSGVEKRNSKIFKSTP